MPDGTLDKGGFIAHVRSLQEQTRRPGVVTWRWEDFGFGHNTVTVPDDEWGWAHLWGLWCHVRRVGAVNA